MNELLNDVLDTTPATDLNTDLSANVSETKELTTGQLVGLSALAGAAGGGIVIGLIEGGKWIATKIKAHKAAKEAKKTASEVKKD